MAAASQDHGMVDPAIFESLQAKIDEESEVREQIKNILQKLEKQGRLAQSVLARVHSTPGSQLGSILSSLRGQIIEQQTTFSELSKVTSRIPYYKYNSLWSRDVQNTIFLVLYASWLEGAVNGSTELLAPIDQVGQTLGVPVNLKDEDRFHISIEEYLQSLITLIDELARLAVNSVTLGDFERPLQISKFIKAVHSGFQILNLKNDSLRRRSDSIKYSVKKVEDVVYDLSLRNLIPKEGPAAMETTGW